MERNFEYVKITGTPIIVELATVVESLKESFGNAVGWDWIQIELTDDGKLGVHEYDCYGWGDNLEEECSEWIDDAKLVEAYKAIAGLEKTVKGGGDSPEI